MQIGNGELGVGSGLHGRKPSRGFRCCQRYSSGRRGRSRTYRAEVGLFIAYCSANMAANPRALSPSSANGRAARVRAASRLTIYAKMGETARSYRPITRPPIDIGEERALVCGLPTAIWVKRSAAVSIPHGCASRPVPSRDRIYRPKR